MSELFHALPAPEIIEADYPPVRAHLEYIDPKGKTSALLPTHGKMVIGGEPGIGKSFLLMELAGALVSGLDPFSGPFRVPHKCRVLYLEQEMSEAGIKDRSKIWTHIPRKDLMNLLIVSQRPELDLTGMGFDHFKRLIQETEPNVLILDPWSKFHSSKENDASEMSMLCRKLDHLIREFYHNDLSILYDTHLKKPVQDTRGRDKDDRFDANSLRGSSVVHADVDTAMILGRHGRPNKTPSGSQTWRLASGWKVRHGEQPDRLAFSFNKHDDLRVRYDGVILEDVAPIASGEPEPRRGFAKY